MRARRRDVFKVLALPLAGCGTGTASSMSTADGAADARLPVTPACDAGEPLTQSQTEGPYFSPNSPERSSLVEAGDQGRRIHLRGLVVSRGCETIDRALVDLWHCDGAGVYDNPGFRFRGHQFADAFGGFVFDTIVPGLYPGRTRHFHVKVQAPGRPVLTTQLYFPGEPGNERDGIFRPELMLQLDDGPTGTVASFMFVMDV